MMSTKVFSISFYAFALAFLPQPLLAQSAAGQWIGAYAEAGFPSPQAACQAQWEGSGQNSTQSRLLPPEQIDMINYGCKWTSNGYLCSEEGNTNCGDRLPATVWFHCPYPGIPAGDNTCVDGNEFAPEQPPGPYSHGGICNKTVGNPFSVVSGAKLETEVDLSGVNERFLIERHYRSAQPSSYLEAWRGRFQGGVNGWRFGFDMELHVGTNFNLTLYEPTGAALNFSLSNDGVFQALGFRQTDYRVELIGTIPSNLNDWRGMELQSHQWRILDSTGRTWLLKTFNPNRNKANQYAVARPLSVVYQDGYTINYHYDLNDELDKLSDSFGNYYLITWRKLNVTSNSGITGSQPIADVISQITASGGKSVRYTYDPPEALPSTDFAQRLVKVEQLDEASAVLSSRIYHYEDSRFASHLTGLTDERGTRYATFSYDGSGRTTKSEHAGQVERYSASYGQESGSLKVTVTNPLGKVAVYTVSRSYNDARLTAVDGIASTNCAAGVTSLTYGTDNFIASSTDEEGRKTTYVRDALGRPTSITRGAP